MQILNCPAGLGRPGFKRTGFIFAGQTDQVRRYQMIDFALHINYNEFKIGSEIPLLLKLRLKNLFRHTPKTKGKILIVDTCIIGDFLATLPALRAFIEASGQSVDIIVSPPLKSLAKAIKGVDRVFTAKSVYSRQIENVGGGEAIPKEYSHVLVMRISQDAYSILDGIKYSTIKTYDIPYYRYFGHLVKNILLKKKVRQWREINYEIIGIPEPAKKAGFTDIFSFTENDYAEVAARPELGGNGKKVMIHTGSGWNIKLWENAKWTELLSRINKLGDFSFIFTGGGAFEEESFNHIQKNLDFKTYSLVNKVDLRETMLAMRLCDYFIGIDSGPRNMAHLADLRSISLLGPAPKNFMPINEEDIVIDKFDCRCKSLFYLHKISGMQKISVDEVLDCFKKLLKTRPARNAAVH